MKMLINVGNLIEFIDNQAILILLNLFDHSNLFFSQPIRIFAVNLGEVINIEQKTFSDISCENFHSFGKCKLIIN